MSNVHPIIEVENLVVKRGQSTVLTIPYFSIFEGETLAVIGPNGAGKSTFLLALSQLLTPSEGEIKFRNKPLNPKDSLAYRRGNALVFQTPLLLNSTVFNNIAT